LSAPACTQRSAARAMSAQLPNAAMSSSGVNFQILDLAEKTSAWASGPVAQKRETTTETPKPAQALDHSSSRPGGYHARSDSTCCCKARAAPAGRYP
jgi:hypothetical protein